MHNLNPIIAAVALCALVASSVAQPYQPHRRKAFRTVAGAYLINQNFEGTGYDNGEAWTENGTPDPNYTATVLKGSQSLRVTSGDYPQIAFAGQTDVYFHCRIRVGATGPNTALQLANAGGTVLAGIKMTITVNLDVQLESNGGLSAVSAFQGATSTLYYLWIDYHSSGTCVLAMGPNTTRPTVDSVTEAYLTRAGAADTCTKILLYAGGVGSDLIIDNVLISTTAIGNNPNP